MQRQERYVREVQRQNRIKDKLWLIVICLSLVAVLCVFWWLKITGITLAGEAFCGKDEHQHSEACRGLVCEQEETEAHTHTDACYGCEPEIFEEHIHTEVCYGCVPEEIEEHAHTDECLTCEPETPEEHTHAETCLVCKQVETPGHIHSDACYESSCEKKEHIHDSTCYSDITADLETEEEWEKSLAGIDRATTTAENVVLVARSQLGVTESEKNFEVDAHGIRRGITRYGQWYGNPYGDWSAMFASFCLHYAGAEDVPANAGPEAMRLEWEKADLYKDAEQYAPQVGDLVFLSQKTDADSPTTGVAIITKVTKETITVIEGDVEGAVAEVTYPIEDARVVGYGLVPETSGYAAFAAPPSNTTSIAVATNYSSSMLTSGDRFVFYVERNGATYAFDGSGNAVKVYVDDDGRIHTDLTDPNVLLWTIERYNNNSHAIQNVGTGRYLHPFYNSGNDNGITTPGRWGTTVSAAGTGVKFSHSAYIRLDEGAGKFQMTRTSGENITFRVGVTRACTVWLDGTCGGLMSLGGSDDRSYTVNSGGTMTLPTQWKSPEKYHYVLRGWYDISNNTYYEPGATMPVTGNAVLYADWQAASYDIGEFNAQVDSETLDTNDFITTRVFDYGILFNLLSENVDITVNSSGHSEVWNLLTSGDNPYNGEETLGFIFRDWDRGGEDISYPKGHDAANNPTNGGVYPGLYTDTIRDLLFDPEVQTLGKTYLGEGNHLFQLCTDMSHDHYGDYYYNSERNAASYNQSDQRFYVYDYLECTRDSTKDNGNYSDFLPFNSPYANTNGKQVVTYNYAGVDGKYEGTTHYMYDSKYNTENNTANYVGTNYLFGMSIEIRFFLPNKPGTLVTNEHYGNEDIYGDQMHFRFTGDDDVWVFVDGQMLLDLGGLHGRENGEINFSTGVVTVNGVVHEEYSNLLKQYNKGEHILTFYYLERGSSLANCSIYFNLAPRYDFTIYKEDVLTGEPLNGSEFSVYEDLACTVPAELWTSYEAKLNGEPSTNVFTIKNGKASMWGFSSGNTYYIRETKPPDAPHYGMPHGIICLTFVKKDVYNYHAEIIPDSGGVSPGFMIHEFRVDNETQTAYIHATNGADWIKETTSITTRKRWADDKNHDDHLVTVYLTVTDRDGTVRRLQEERLYSENNWMVTWENLPKYWEDGLTPIQYGVEEAYSSGYYGIVEEHEGEFVVTYIEWVDRSTFENGKEYVLRNPDGMALATYQYADDTGFKWVTEREARNSDLALWTASVKNGTVRLTNRRGQTITYWYASGNPTDFYASATQGENNDRKQYFTFTQTGSGLVLRYNNRYLSPNLNSSNKFLPTSTNAQSAALRLIPSTMVSVTTQVPVEGQGFLLTNAPLDKETSVTVRKDWVIPADMDESVYEQEMVTVKLFANGIDTGRTVTLTLKNGWQDTFLGLPYEDEDGKVIVYTVQEVWKSDQWSVSYGAMTPSGGTIPIYGTTITNTYRVGGPPLPTTGSPARLLFTVYGIVLMLIPLVVGFGLRRKRERRRE